jgi:uncharacterized protein with PQ loop repeat
VLLVIPSLTLTLGVVAPALSVLVCVAQAWRILRAGAHGVSVVTWILSTFVAEMWTAYGLIFHVPAELYCNLPFLAVSSIVIVTAARHAHRELATSLGVVAVTAATVAIALACHDPHWRWIISTVAVCGAVFIYLPQLAVALRSTNLHGVSIVSWIIAFVTSLCWAAYGALIHQPPVALPAIVMAPSAAIIVVQVARHRRVHDR